MGGSLGLDVGTLTIGVAATDSLGMMAHPILTITRRSVVRDADEVAKIARDRKVDRVIVGMPYELDGTEERSARLARQIGERVAEVTGLPVEYVDERYSSVEAEARLIQANVSRSRRKEIIDQLAAVIILERWLARPYIQT